MFRILLSWSMFNGCHFPEINVELKKVKEGGLPSSSFVKGVKSRLHQIQHYLDFFSFLFLD